MKKLLTLIATMTICNAYGETVWWINSYMGRLYSVNTCDDDSSITLPTGPTRPGYRFIGWKESDFNPANFFGSGYNINPSSSSDATKPTNWSLSISMKNTSGNDVGSGSISGISRCSNTGGNVNSVGDPSTTDGKYCWCQVTQIANTSTGGDTFTLSNMPWVLRGTSYTSLNSCQMACANNCANSAFSAGVRPRMLGIQ